MANRHSETTTYVIELRALPSDSPPAIRLKMLLKTALRSYHLRCTSVSEKRPDDDRATACQADTEAT